MFLSHLLPSGLSGSTRETLKNLHVMYSQIEASTSPRGIPKAFDVFSCPGGREFDEVSLPGTGHLITTHRGWGI